MEIMHLTVGGMTCGSCVKHVEKAIYSIAGVEGVEVDLASGAVKVRGNVAQMEKEIIAALEEDGYPAQVSLGEASKVKSGLCKSGSSCCCS
jgi:copper chaperone